MKREKGFEIETPLQAEARLRAALQSAQIQILPTPYSWQPCAVAPGATSSSDEAIAMMRSDQGWCQLAPANGSAGREAWALARLQFDPGAQLDGFVDWFAARLRQRLHSRVTVASASSGPAHVAYWGIPEPYRDGLGRELAILASTPRTSTRSVGLL